MGEEHSRLGEQKLAERLSACSNDYIPPILDALPPLYPSRQIDRMEVDADRLLLASILAMEPSSHVLQLARKSGNGRISPEVQRFLFHSCLRHPTLMEFPSTPSYLRGLLKQLILAAEDEGEEVLDSLYEKLMEMLKATKNEMEDPVDSASRCYRTFLYSIPNDSMTKISGCIGSINASMLKDMTVTARVSSNMLEGDTGCYVWPAGLFLSEFLLANPGIFTGRCCLEIGAGTGLNSICLARLKASKVIATDGNPLTIDNLKHNFRVNGMLPNDEHQMSKVEFRQLIWEAVTDDDIQSCGAEIIIGADIIYDVDCIPHLVRLLSCLLNCTRDKSDQSGVNDDCIKKTKSVPTAFIATTIRNENTLQTFVALAESAGLFVEDITGIMRIPVFLPQLANIDRSRIRLHNVRSR